ncbi:MAG: signal peptidase II [Syntrophomonadaceae bacterium]|jgi:signal peptidase II|nr:signal peptidase II [Syntrophomonadaceae bacterium]NLX01567.1 signal peptidase II [Syntrophomonadaceae bacterium]
MRFWLTTLLVLVIDQLSKLWIVNNFAPGESRVIWNKVLWLTYVQNQGAAFGILQGHSWLFFLCAILVMIILVVINSKQRLPVTMQVIFGLIMAGAIGNLLDRLRLNYVVDFFDLGWWPVFNIADMAIVCGAILLVIKLLWDEKGEHRASE